MLVYNIPELGLPWFKIMSVWYTLARRNASSILLGARSTWCWLPFAHMKRMSLANSWPTLWCTIFPESFLPDLLFKILRILFLTFSTFPVALKPKPPMNFSMNFLAFTVICFTAFSYSFLPGDLPEKAATASVHPLLPCSSTSTRRNKAEDM